MAGCSWVCAVAADTGGRNTPDYLTTTNFLRGANHGLGVFVQKLVFVQNCTFNTKVTFCINGGFYIKKQELY
jgi:hypothetical protein